jgi:23S rRNA pseudouridine1911/1915/1917 synthase
VVRIISADRGDIGTRVDRVLLRHLHDVRGISRNKIQRLIDAGAVRINDEPARRISWRIAPGDRIVIDLPDIPQRQRPVAESLPLELVYEDDEVVVVNKAPGQVAHPAFRNTTGTLLNALLGHAAGHWTPALVNRLDKDTSGLVLVAKSSAVQQALQGAMQRNDVEKDYLAIVAGKPRPARGTIDLALDRDPWDRRRVMVRDRGGQPSVTKYQRMSTTADGKWSLVRCRLITGRTHQIRVHLASKGWPIIGDRVYGVADLRIGRQALHAWRLSFEHPRRRERLTFIARVPDDMARVMSATGLLEPRETRQHGSQR